MKNYKQLIVWRKGIELVKTVYFLTKQLPPEEKFGIASQMNRASVSIPANIAEGSSRDSDKDYVRFLQIALGSAFELQTYCVVIKELNLNLEKITETEILAEEIIKMLHTLIRKIKSQIANS